MQAISRQSSCISVLSAAALTKPPSEVNSLSSSKKHGLAPLESIRAIVQTVAKKWVLHLDDENNQRRVDTGNLGEQTERWKLEQYYVSRFSDPSVRNV